MHKLIDKPTETCEMHYDWIFLEGKEYKMEARPRDKHYNAVKALFRVTKISYGILEQSYFSNLWLEWTEEKNATLVYMCVHEFT